MPSLWTSPATGWLASGGRRAFEADLLGRFRSLASVGRLVLGEKEGTGPLCDAHDALTAPLATMDEVVFQARRTPFLAMNVNRAIERMAQGDRPGFNSALQNVLIHAIDCFHSELRDTLVPSFPNAAAHSRLHLPACKCQVPLTAASDTRICFGRKGGQAAPVTDLKEIIAELPNGSEPFREIRLRNGQTLILERSLMLFEPEYIDKIFNDISQPEKLSDLIDHALDFIFIAWPDIEPRFREDISTFLPIRQSDARTHNSFSAQSMVGVLFLSESYDDLKIAEAIVHEYHHNELYMYMQLNPLISDSGHKKLYYSPWRADARPLFGLLHACYVFTGVAHYMRNVERLASDAEFGRYFARMRSLVLRRIEIGVSQIADSDTTETGAKFVTWIRAQLRDHLADASARQMPDAGSEIIQHMQAWRARYPDLSHSLVET